MGKRSNKGIITEVISERDRIPPILVDFKNGSIDPENANVLEFKVYRNPTTNMRMISTDFDNVTYRGECKKESLHKFLAIRDKSTNEVKLVKAALCTLSPLLKLKMAVKRDMTDKEIRGELAKAYGTKSKRMRAILAETLQMDSEDAKLVATNMPAVNSSPVQPPSDSVYDILPPHDRKASTIEDVYKLEDILLPSIHYCFEEEVKRIMNKPMTDLKEEKFSEFFIGAWSGFQNRYDQEKKIFNLKCLLYIECIGTLLNVSPQNLKKPTFHACYFSEALSEHILEMFSSNSVTGRLCSKAQKDKAICYILVLCFLIFDYKVDLSSLIKITKSSMTRLSQLSRVAGAKVNKDHLANLTLPLAVPPAPRKPKKN